MKYGLLLKRVLLVAIWAGLFIGFPAHAAAPLVGSFIDNRASARYVDPNTNLLSKQDSNLVRLQVAALAALTLTSDRSIAASPNTTVSFAHRLTNTGNTPTSYTLTYANLISGDDYDIPNLALYLDVNGNGVADAGEPKINSGDVTVALNPGQSIDLVLAGAVPGSVASGKIALATITATSTTPNLTDTPTVTNNDRVQVAGGVIVGLSKQAINTTPKAGDEVPFSFTLTNSGSANATAVPIQVNGVTTPLIIVRDAIPANTTFSGFGTLNAAQGLYHKLGDPRDTYATTAPADLSQVDAVAFGLTALPAGAAINFIFKVKVNGNATGDILNIATANYNDGINPQTSSIDSNQVKMVVPFLAPTIKYYTSPAFTTPTSVTTIGQPLYVQADSATCNADSVVQETHVIIITSKLTGDSETFTAIESGPNTGKFRILPSIPTRSGATNPVQANNGILETLKNDVLTAQINGCGASSTTTIILIDPSGVVFDSTTNLPLAGATVQLIDVTGAGNGGNPGGPAAVFLADGTTPAPSSVVTGVDGLFEFPLVKPSTYRLVLTPPNGYAFPSLVPANQLSPDRIINLTGSYGKDFTVTLVTGPVVLDVPLDPRPLGGLFVQKSANRTTVDVGEFVDYSLKIKNSSGALLPNVQLTDGLPAGFAYQAGTARLAGAGIADPVGGAGPRLVFSLGTLAADTELILTYRVGVRAGALQGDGINRATASSGINTSNLAAAKVKVLPGVFSDKGIIIGKVYVDCSRNRVQENTELGIPGVRVYLEDGTNVVSDSEGKFSFYGISPRTHILKLDNTTMPIGAELINLSNRNAGDAGSRFVDLKNGELHKANFAEGSCTPAILEQVKARRAKAEVLVAETETGLKNTLTTDGKPVAIADPKALPASGSVGSTSSALSPSNVFNPLLPQGALAQNSQALPKAAFPLPEPVLLEKLMEGADNQLGFLNLKDGDTLPYQQTSVAVKGANETQFVLSLNGEVVPDSRVGKRSVHADSKLQAWEYIGINLKPGVNTFELAQSDAFGNARGASKITVTAPDKLGKLKIELGQIGTPADGVTPARFTVKLSDDKGVPVTVRTPVTIEASLGRIQADDLNKNEPGIQVFIEGGSAQFTILPPQEPGEALIRVSSGVLKDEARLDFLPDLRPLIGAGVIEGILNLRKLNTNALVPARKQDGFEQELIGLSREYNNGKNQAAARAAFFLKGKVKGEYLLTMGYDSDKDTKERLFRDIQPDEFYPVYGDSSLRNFDAQSTGRLYVRVDNKKSYLLYGDFITQSNTDSRRLSNYNRSLTGIKEHYESGNVAVNAFASRDSSRQLIEEFPATGTSGPFTLSNPNGLENSEKVEVITRDRDQPSLVLKTVPLTRFLDYEIEPLGGRILLKGPQRSTDDKQNPIFIRVTYEVEQGGKAFWVGGLDAQIKITDNIEVGAAYVTDRNPLDTFQLKGANATVKFSDKTFAVIEFAQTNKESIGSGKAARVEIKHKTDDIDLNVYAGKAGVNFDNSSSTLTKGREEAGAKLAYNLSQNVRLIGEALHSKDTATGGTRNGELLGAELNLDNGLKVEAGVRHSSETAVAAQATSVGTTPNDVNSVRLKIGGQVPGVPEASVYGEYEQDVKDHAKKTEAIGGEYQLGPHARTYLRHEFISTLSGQFALNNVQRQNSTVFGVDTDYMQDGHLFSEYRVRDAFASRDAEAAIGLRNLWQLSEGVRLSTGFERVHALGATSASALNNESTAITLGAEYTASPLWKASERLELRKATTSDSLLYTFGLARKLNRDWTFLGKNAWFRTTNKGLQTGEKTEERLQIGAAYREADSDVLNALVRLEHRALDDTTTQNIELKRTTELFSTQFNYQPTKPMIISGRLAASWVKDRSNGLRSQSAQQLLGARVMYDLTHRWDIGVVGNVFFSDGRQYGLGLESGYILTSNLWLSAGYNFFGIKETDLTTDYTNRGAYLRLRYKFDEDTLEAMSFKGNEPAGAEASK